MKMVEAMQSHSSTIQIFDLLTFDTWDFFEATEPVFQNSARSIHVTTAVNLLGAFEKLRLVRHAHLLQYVDICRAPRERIVIVQEQCNGSIFGLPKFSDDAGVIVQIFYELASAVEILHRLNIVSVNISPRTVCCAAGSTAAASSTVKLINYGLLYLKSNGLSVDNVGDPRYFAPELLAEPDLLLCPSFVDWQTHCKADIWSLALTMMCLLLQQQPIDLILTQIRETAAAVRFEGEYFRILLTLKSDESFLDKLNKIEDAWLTKLHAETSSKFVQLLRKCLLRNAALRPTAAELKSELKNLLQSSDFTKPVAETAAVALRFLPETINSSELILPERNTIKARPPLDELYLDEIYYLWKVSGGDAVRESSSSCTKTNSHFDRLRSFDNAQNKDVDRRRRSSMSANRNFSTDQPIILSLPLVTHSEFSTCRLPATNSDLTRRFSCNSAAVFVAELDVERLRSKLSELSHAFYPLFERLGKNRSENFSEDSATSLPIVIRERNVFYTYHRVVLFRHLLESYPYSRDLLLNEARIDIPPLYRGQTYAALLSMRCNMSYMYDELIDKISPTSADRQIEVDVPRCHQYEPLLSSPAAHEKFKNILKAWVRTSYPHYVYWQGLDSLCAPFLFLNFNNEALAFECLRRFIDKYLAGFFIHDNTNVIREYLAIFQHLVAFHDPQLAYHLYCIGFQAELFAIPWFLTCFAHIFPLEKIFLLWDALLLADSTFPLFIGLALLRSLRAKLLQLGFNECILLFSDLPDVDIEKIRHDAWEFSRTTPKSVVVRNLDLTLLPESSNDGQIALRSRSASMQSTSKLIPVETLCAEVCPRILIDDLLSQVEYKNYIDASSAPYAAMKHVRMGKQPPLVVIDIRSHEDYERGGSLACSMNVPAAELLLACEVSSVAANSRATVHLQSLKQHFDGKLIVVLDSNEKRAAEFGVKLLSYNFVHVCVLHEGIEACRSRKLLGVVQC